MLYHAILISMLGMGQAWADPTESVSPQGSTNTTVVTNLNSSSNVEATSSTRTNIPEVNAPHSQNTNNELPNNASLQINNVEQLQQAPVGNTQAPASVQPAVEVAKPSILPLALGGLGVFLGIFALIYGWRLAGKVSVLAEEKKKLEKKVELEAVSARKNAQEVVDKLKDFIAVIQKLETENIELKATVETLEKSLNSILKTKDLDIKAYLIDDELTISDSTTSTSAQATMTKPSDQEILAELEHLIHSTLSLPQGPSNVLDFKAALEQFEYRAKVATYLLLDNTLEHSSSRFFDALVLFLAEPLSNGANTLVYLRKDTIQHSSISFIFEGVRDGAKVHKTQIPAQLKQLPSMQLELKDDNIVQKGQVLIG